MRPTLLMLSSVCALGSGCSFVYGDAKYVNNDASLVPDADGGDASDGSDAGDVLPDGATGCLVTPELCTDGTRCAADGRCLPCDADGDGSQAPDSTCDAAAGALPRDCDDDDGAAYPGASPVCGDGRINACDAGPASFREALGVAEIGALGTEVTVSVPASDDLSSLSIDATPETGSTGARLFVAWMSDEGPARVTVIDGEDLSTLGVITLRATDVPLGVAARRIDDATVFISALTRDSAGDAVLSSGRHDVSMSASSFSADVYAFDDLPCATAADAAGLASELVLDGAAGTTWLLSASDRALHVSEAFAVSCIAVPASGHHTSGSDGSIVGLVDPTTGIRRALTGSTATVEAIDVVAPGAAELARPGLAFLRAAASDLYLSATVTTAGETRIGPIDCVAGVACAAGTDPAVVYEAGPGIVATHGASLDGLRGDFAAMVQIEERPTAPAPDDRTHDVVLRVVEYPNEAIGGPGEGAPGEALALDAHTFDSTDPDHMEVREVDVATARDLTSGDLTVYWAALLGDRRLAPGATIDPDATNEARYGAVRFCVSE